MKLNKWYVPKSFSFSKVQADTVVLGYFDALEVCDIFMKDFDDNVSLKENSDILHPFTLGYEILAFIKSEQKKELVDFSTQEQILFLNICDEGEEDGTRFAEKTVQDFWNNKSSDCPYLFLSMIHISHSGMLAQALQKINAVFQKDYLSYISYDYCDIVLFARNMQITKFMDRITKLFEAVPGKKGNGVIFDTFSMVSFYPPSSRQLSSLRLPNEQSWANDKETFQATINLSIRDHKTFNQWYKHWYEEESKKFGIPAERYNLFGRHDISITKEDANTEWLMNIMLELHEENNQKMFWTFETFIKVKSDATVHKESAISNHLEKIHKKVAETLRTEIGKLEQVVIKLNVPDRDRYIMPVYEVRDCICSIVKNSFAEEFVCCIYESFLHFVSYMTTKIELLANCSKNYIGLEDQIAESYDKYFAALNTLVNSTMHNERQFVQATAFNAVFYSVPPKIMAFYNAYIYRIKEILKDESPTNQYTFLIYPSFSPTIALEQISLDDAPPCDRLLTVTINEKALYDIQSVMYQMVHELAHYVGNELRCRENIRKQKIEHTLLKWIMQECRIDKDAYQMLLLFLSQELFVSDEDTVGQESKHNRYIYLDNLHKQAFSFIKEIDRLQGFGEFGEKYYQNKMESDEVFYDEFLEDIGIEKENQKAYVTNFTRQYADVKCKEIKSKIKAMGKPRTVKDYELYIDLMKSVYRECYADLQMIIVLGMNAEDYLNTFLIHQGVPVEQMLEQFQDMTRISTVFRVMIDSHLWNAPTEHDNEFFRIVFELISDYNHRIEQCMDKERISESQQKVNGIVKIAKYFDFNNGIHLKESLTKERIAGINGKQQKFEPDPLIDLAADLYEYLLEVLEKSLKEYSKKNKSNQIQQVRNLVNRILNFEDAVDVFSCVESELDYYKTVGCKI